MTQALCFDDVLITPKFSQIRSRKDVSTHFYFCGMYLTQPIISANMDTITGPKLAAAMNLAGGVGCLHRFCSIQENVQMFLDTVDLTANNKSYKAGGNTKPLVAIGIGASEVSRALALREVGANVFVIDVAHGAAMHVVEQYDKLRSVLGSQCFIIVGNFANAESIVSFNNHVKSNKFPDAYKIGIGGGGLCSTRIVTGCGLPTFASVVDCARLGLPIICDGGVRNSGDYCKALGAGADLVMAGGLFAGTDETPGELSFERCSANEATHAQLKVEDGMVLSPQAKHTLQIRSEYEAYWMKATKRYRGSASAESYAAQGKEAVWRAPEGEATDVPYKGPVSSVIQSLDGGLRSAMAYVGANSLEQFRARCTFETISANSHHESLPHGKRS